MDPRSPEQEPGSRSGGRGGAGSPEAARTKARPALGRQWCASPPLSPESSDRVGRSAGPGGAVQAGEAGLKGSIPGEVLSLSQPAFSSAQACLRPPVRGRWAAGEGSLSSSRSRCPRRLWLCSERPREPHLPPPGPYSTVEMQNTSLQLPFLFCVHNTVESLLSGFNLCTLFKGLEQR